MLSAATIITIGEMVGIIVVEVFRVIGQWLGVLFDNADEFIGYQS